MTARQLTRVRELTTLLISSNQVHTKSKSSPKFIEPATISGACQCRKKLKLVLECEERKSRACTRYKIILGFCVIFSCFSLSRSLQQCCARIYLCKTQTVRCLRQDEM